MQGKAAKIYPSWSVPYSDPARAGASAFVHQAVLWCILCVCVFGDERQRNMHGVLHDF